MTATPARLTPLTAMSSQIMGENPIFRQILGICSALAVTNLLFNTMLMCLGLIWAVVMSSITISVMRRWIPLRVRMMVQVLTIAAFVIMVDIAMRVWAPTVHVQIAAYVGLIITNCIIMGRLEAFAMKNRPSFSFMDGLGNGLGYAGVLVAVALFREALGFGSLFGYPLPALDLWWRQWTIMVVPPGAFFVLGLIVWAGRSYTLSREQAAAGAVESQVKK